MFPGSPRGELGAGAGGRAGEIGQAEGLGVRLTLACQDRAGPEQSLGLIEGSQGVPPRIGLATRRQPDVEVRPEDPQVQEVGPEPLRGGRVQGSAELGEDASARLPGRLEAVLQGPQRLGRREVRPVEEAEPVGQLVELPGQLAVADPGELPGQVPTQVIGSRSMRIE